MPFDGLISAPTKVRLEDMPAILRDQSRWPTHFSWDYSRTNRCALGLGRELGADSYAWRRRLGWFRGHYVFFRPNSINGFAAVTPETVARRLERALSKGPLTSLRIAGGNLAIPVAGSVLVLAFLVTLTTAIHHII